VDFEKFNFALYAIFKNTLYLIQMQLQSSFKPNKRIQMSNDELLILKNALSEEYGKPKPIKH